jgi:hypothetical protein
MADPQRVLLLVDFVYLKCVNSLHAMNNFGALTMCFYYKANNTRRLVNPAAQPARMQSKGQFHNTCFTPLFLYIISPNLFSLS